MPELRHALVPNKRVSEQDKDALRCISVVLEEGQNLTHPDLPAGPRELFAEVFWDCQARGSGEQPRDAWYPAHDDAFSAQRFDM